MIQLLYVIIIMMMMMMLQSCWEILLSGPSNKSVSGRVLRVVADRCRGAATEVAPLLLPLLAHMPDTALQQPLQYYRDMLRALANWSGRSSLQSVCVI